MDLEAFPSLGADGLPGLDDIFINSYAADLSGSPISFLDSDDIEQSTAFGLGDSSTENRLSWMPQAPKPAAPAPTFVRTATCRGPAIARRAPLLQVKQEAPVALLPAPVADVLPSLLPQPQLSMQAPALQLPQPVHTVTQQQPLVQQQEAQPAQQPQQQSTQHQPDAHDKAHSSHTVHTADHDSDGSSDGDERDHKRRRRVRNAKQQELNRLAQQRYRQRKKEKFSTMQSTVDELAHQVAKVGLLEAENGQLRAANGQLQQQLASQAAALAEAQQHIAAQQAEIGVHKATIAELRQGQQQRHGAAAAAAASGAPRSASFSSIGDAAAAATPAPAQQPAAAAVPRPPSPSQQHVSGASVPLDQVLAAFKSALEELSAQHGLAATEKLVHTITRTLSSCRDPAALGSAGAAQGAAGAGGPAKAPAITVSCC